MNAPCTMLAVDPGAISGAMAVRFHSGDIYVSDLPVVNGQMDAAAFARIVQDMHIAVAVVERVGAMPKQGLASTFKFGYACGAIYGVLAACAVPVHYVTPQVWKKHHGLIGLDKEAGRALAIRLHPGVSGLELKRHKGRAEALLMLDWFRSTKGNDHD